MWLSLTELSENYYVLFCLESIADVNLTTLKLSLPEEEILPTNFDTEQSEMEYSTSSHNSPDEARYEDIICYGENT